MQSQNFNLPKQVKHTKDSFRCDHLQIFDDISHQQLNQCVRQLLSICKKALWIRLQGSNLKHIDFLCNKLDFKIHHGIQKNIYLYKWVSPLSDLIPGYSMFVIACGAIVISDEKVLIIQEKGGPRKGQFGLPGGRADFGEMVYQCAQRQLFEQTGVKAKYKELQKTVFGATDFYFGCVMQATEEQLKNMKLCSRQIKSHQWIHLKEVGDLMKVKAKGTQVGVCVYLQKLYQKGFRFEKGNKAVQEYYDCRICPRDGVQKRSMHHRFVSTLRTYKK